MRDTAIKAAREAGKILMDNFNKVHDIKHKSKKDLVTDVDKKSEQKIISIIKKRFPEHAMLTEESGEIDGNHDYTWIIDPLDGTHNYVYGIEDFGVLIAVMHKKRIILGVIYLPVLDKLIVAEKGKGTIVNGVRVHVSDRKMEEAMIIYGSNLTQEEKKHDLIKISKACFGVRIVGCSAMHAYRLATGKCDGWLPQTAHPWDLAPGFIAIAEAGGKITNRDLEKTDIFHKMPIISNGVIHKDLAKLLKGNL